MSADDFQTKYASVMESMLKSAVAETTKLFETMVNELKAEISSVRKENQDLKTRCRQFEEERRQQGRHRAPFPGTSDVLKTHRDTAVQCDLGTLHTFLVEQCQPLRISSLQNHNQQHDHEEIDYTLQDHNYESQEESNSQMAFKLVNQEFVSKQEEGAPNLFYIQVWSNEAGSPQDSVCGIENERALVTQESSTEETPLCMEVPSLGTESGLQGTQSQSSAIRNREQQSEDGQVSEIKTQTQTEWLKSEKSDLMTDQHQSEMVAIETGQPSVNLQCQRGAETSVNKKLRVTLQQCADVQSTVEKITQRTPPNEEKEYNGLNNDIKGNDCTQPDLPVLFRRRKPTMTKKKRKQPVEELQQSQPSDIITRHHAQSHSPKREKEIDGSSTVSTLNVTSLGTLIEPNGSSITLSVQEKETSKSEEVENGKVVSVAVPVVSLTQTCSSEEEKYSETQKCSIEMGEGTVHAPIALASFKNKTLQTAPANSVKHREHQTSATLQDAMLLVEAMNQPTIKNRSSKQQMERPQQTQCRPRASPVGTSQSVDGVLPQQQTQLLTVEILKAANKAHVGHVSRGVQKEEQSAASESSDDTSSNESEDLITFVKPESPHSAIPSETTTSSTSTQTSVQSLQQHPPRPLIKWLAPSEQVNAVPPKVIVVSRPSTLMSHKITALSPTKTPTVKSTVAGQNDGILPASSAESFAFERPLLSPQKINCAYTQQPTSPSKDRQAGSLQQPKIIKIPKVVPPMTNPSKTCVLTIKDAVVPVTMSSPRELRFTVDERNVLDETAMIFSQNKGDLYTIDNLRSRRISPKALNGPTKPCSSLNMSVRSTTVKQPVEVPLSTVARLTKQLFPVSSKESLSVLGLPTDEPTQTQSVLKEGTTDKTVSINASGMSKARNVNQKDSVSSALEETPSATHVQPSKQSRAPAAVLEKSSVAVTITTPSALLGLAIEPNSYVSGETTGVPVRDCANDKQPPAAIHLTPRKGSKDSDDPHIQMTKTQFLAQLAVSPVLQDPNKDSSNDSLGTSASLAGIITREQRNNLVAKLRSHLKTHTQTTRPETDREPCTEIKTDAVMTPKKPKPRKDSQTCSESQGTDEDDIPLKTTNSSLQTPIQLKDGLRSGRAIKEPASVAKGSGSSTPLTRRRSRLSREIVGCKNEEATPMRTRRSSSSKEGFTPKKTRMTSVKLRKSCSTKDIGAPNIKNNNWASLTGANTCRKNTKAGLSPNKTKTTSEITERAVHPKNIKPTSVRPKASSLDDESTNSRMASKDKGFVRRKCTFKVTSYSNNPRSCNMTVDGESAPNTNSKTQIAAEVSPRKSREFTLSSEEDETVDVSKKTKRLKLSQLAESHNSEVVKKCMAKALWTPPQLKTKAPFPGGRRSSPLGIKKDAKSPKSQNHPVVYPPSVSLHPIPVKAPPVESPLEPLSVIGKRLLKNQCGECGRILSSTAALESHVGLHTGHRPFSCKLCGKHFVDSKGLKRHDRVHRNGRIHICKECGKGFVYRFGLTKHLQMVHGRVKPHTCPVCSKAFFTSRDMDTHKRIHTGEKPFHCNLCEKKFARRVELNMHLRWHNGEKRHWCPYCGKGFLDPNNLKRHKYTHTGERPFSCPHCPKKFTQSAHLKKHVRNVHKLE